LAVWEEGEVRLDLLLRAHSHSQHLGCCFLQVDSSELPAHYAFWNLLGCPNQQMVSARLRSGSAVACNLVFSLLTTIFCGLPALVLVAAGTLVCLPCCVVSCTRSPRKVTENLSSAVQAVVLLLFAVVVIALAVPLVVVVLALACLCLPCVIRTTQRRRQERSSAITALQQRRRQEDLERGNAAVHTPAASTGSDAGTAAHASLPIPPPAAASPAAAAALSEEPVAGASIGGDTGLSLSASDPDPQPLQPQPQLVQVVVQS
jgi:hypothetical protein